MLLLVDIVIILQPFKGEKTSPSLTSQVSRAGQTTTHLCVVVCGLFFHMNKPTLQLVHFLFPFVLLTC